MTDSSPLPDDNIRVGTAEREGVADLLNDAFEQGRLTLSEHSERLHACFSATTRADLRALVVDLPGGGDVKFSDDQSAAGTALGDRTDSSSGSSAVARRTPPEKADAEVLRSIWVPWASVSVLVTTIWLLTALTSGEPYYFWPMWVIGPWGAVNVVATLGHWGKRRGE